MIGHNRMTRQPSCLQCKQADRNSVSRSSLFVAAVSVCSMLLCRRLLLLHYPSAPAVRVVDTVMFVVCARSGLWTWILHHWALLQSRLGKRKGLYSSSSSVASVSSASFSVTLTIVSPLEPHIFVTKRQHAFLLDCSIKSCCVFLSNSVCVNKPTTLIVLSSRLTFITVLSLTDCMVPTMWQLLCW